nr:MAG TPA: hypothetical protein [Caudoviricetes sp.]
MNNKKSPAESFENRRGLFYALLYLYNSSIFAINAL